MKGRIVYKKQMNAAGECIDVPGYFIDGLPVNPAEFLAAFPDQSLEGMSSLMTPFAKGWPMASEAMEVHPSQIDLARKLDKKRGTPPTEYNRLGQPIWTSEDHKRKFNKAHGVHDNNSYNC